MKNSARLPVYVFSLVASATVVFAACSGRAKTQASPSAMPQVGDAAANGYVVKSRAVIPVTVNSAGEITGIHPAASPTAEQPIEVTNAVNTELSLDTSGWITPVVANSVADFGFLQIATLIDNNLNVCGAGANEHCGAAIIRTYTTGKPGAGVWNDVDGYGAPITASLYGLPPTGTVGLNPEGALVLQSIEIPATQHVVRLSDFTPTPRYGVKADFTNAGAGTYSTTLVIEYLLAPSLVGPSPTPEPSPTVSPEPSPTVTPEPSPTITPEPSPTVTPEPSPTITPEPSPSFRH